MGDAKSLADSYGYVWVFLPKLVGFLVEPVVHFETLLGSFAEAKSLHQRSGNSSTSFQALRFGLRRCQVPFALFFYFTANTTTGSGQTAPTVAPLLGLFGCKSKTARNPGIIEPPHHQAPKCEWEADW